MKRSVGSVLRLAVAAILTAIIVWRSDPHAIASAAVHARMSWVALALVLVLADRFLMAYRWLVLLRNIDARPPLGAVLRVFFVSTFVGTFLPATVGGDAVRAYSLAQMNVTAADALASVLMDRLLGIVSLLMVAIAGWSFARDLLHDVAVWVAVVGATIPCAAGVAMIYSERFAALIGRLLARAPVAKIRRLATELVASVRAYSAHHGAVLSVLMWSILVQVLRVGQAYALGRAIGLELPALLYFAFIPIILLVMLLPISIYGLGTGQLAFVGLFTRAGVSSGDAVALSLLFLALGIFGNLPGAFYYVSDLGRRAPDIST